MAGSRARLHRGDDVRRIWGIGKAGRTAAGADAGLIEQEEQRLRLDAVEGDVGGIGKPLGRMSVEFRLWD